MAAYIVTGASRGIGFAFLQNLSSNSANIVIGLVRNKAGVESKIAAWNRTNIHFVQGDLNDYDSLERAVEATAEITGGALVEMFRTNVVGNVHLFNLFLPLVLKGNVKKVITLSTGMADIEIARAYNIHENGPYAISKAALNMAVAKFSAEYSKDGVLFIGICPGLVDTSRYANVAPDDAVKDVLSVAKKASVANGDGGSYVSHFGNKTWL
ncbi:short-chain dehydrogenase [Cucurbitaria berberidis CBS 394.84]|uniref:Short-chain dehydrogenase n=1 Tax=Cucurbitaria berberidis CBS 394.84 TaxID=1168544 RepID=A0A9P4GAB6_9PLEO|nr:short-chain dehydrogenase [Cucurbitaria berberidis CBS 394.84]KAF1841920.1 short-chain dehydrogenase [Cucurbitaria berberidis CBS 394.84]